MPAKLFVKKLSDAASLPKRGSELAAGWDLAASQPVVVPARGKAIVPTDLAVATPGDCYARIAPLGGLAVKKGVDVGAGVVDADYRGAVGVVLFNHGDADLEVNPGDRVAQIILEKVYLDAEVEEVEDLPSTSRGAGGFGSTGVAGDAPAAKVRAISPPLSPPADLLAPAAPPGAAGPSSRAGRARTRRGPPGPR